MSASVVADLTSWFPAAPAWLSTQVVICAAAALGLLVLSLLLRGLQKVISLALAVAVVLGGFWFLRDAWRHKDSFLSPTLSAKLDDLADKTLHSPQAVAAWTSAKAQWSRLTASAEAGAEDVRRKTMADDLTHQAATLRRDGHKSAADELLRLKDQL